MNLELEASSDAAPSVVAPTPAASVATDAAEVADAASTNEPVPSAEPGPFDLVPGPLRRALEERGFDELTTVQLAVLEAQAEGRDLQISSQTGSGKTVALGFVLAEHFSPERSAGGPEALIIVPTRELALQVSRELSWLLAGLPNVQVTSVTGGSPVYLDKKELARGPRVLVGTPGRLLDHVSSGALDLSGVRELVLDEADQMLDMGFREELEGILEKTPESRRTHLVSATFPVGIQRLAERYQRDPFAIEGTRLGEANQDIEHIGHFVRMNERYAALVNLLLLADGERTLVFVEQRAEALELADKLEEDGFTALPLSGELAQSQRIRTLGAFRSGNAKVLVATDVAARGLDVPDVRLVVHTAPPINGQVYTHRSGRTGRAGQTGRSVLFAPPNQRRKMTRLLNDAGVDLRWEDVPGADEIRSELDRRARLAMTESLDAALEAGPSNEHLAQAAELLKERPAEAVVATLLARLEPTRRAEPMDVRTFEPRDELRPQERRSHGRDDRRETPHGNRRDFQNDHRNEPRPTRQDSRGSDRPRDRRPRKDEGRSGGLAMVRFFMNRGSNQGATPGRVLAAVCRRGQVSGADVGSIAVHPNATTFDVAADIAERFERLVEQRDPRDPQTRIRRDRARE